MTSARIVPVRKRGLGQSVISAIDQSWQWVRRDRAKLELRWGQETCFPDGKIIVIFDCGYFRRDVSDGPHRHVRLSINEYHPTGLPPADGSRWAKLGVPMHRWHDPAGHVLLVGRGRKTRAQLGDRAMSWERQKLARIKAAFPGRKVIYRPKKAPHESIPGAKTDGRSDIPHLLKGCALVVTDCSNVGNEAIAHGIPVAADGGPVSDIAGPEIVAKPPPSVAMQQDFLHRLAWWQWSLAEIRAGHIWPWLFEQIKARK